MTRDAKQVVEDGYAAFRDGSLEAWMELLADDVVLHEAASMPYGGDYVGKAEVRRCVDMMIAHWSDFRFDVEEVIAGPEAVFAYGMIGGRITRTGRQVWLPFTERTVVRDGLMVDIRAFYYDTAEIVRTDI